MTWVYVMLQKAKKDFNRYPIYVTVMDKIEQNISNMWKYSWAREINCMNGLNEFEMNELIIVEVIEPLNTFEAFWSNVVISNPYHKHVEVDQVYKDKTTLKVIMEQYTINHRFQFKTKRSNVVR